ncbi:MAG: FAD-dependent monooxygenase [Acidimicrobiia bacterium]|nr:FAD-dependent monooxygenase [Acidimicrobiia bacterium]
MGSSTNSKGRIAIVGAGPAGMATALAGRRAGFEVTVYERSSELRPAGNILNLWPPPQKVLGLLGVDIHDLGAPADSEFRRHDGHVRARVRLPQAVKDEYGGGFIGLLRPGLYRRMLDALADGAIRYEQRVTSFTDTGEKVILHLEGHEDIDADVLVGADGINSVVRRGLWGEQPIRQQKLHLVAGYVFCEAPDPVTIVAHDRTTQASYSAIRHDRRTGYEWWVLEAFDPSAPFTDDLRQFALTRARRFAGPLASLIEQTPTEHLFRWEIRDRKPLKQWSKGRVTIVGDAAHPTSPYAAYGAGMSIEDGYFLAAELEQVDVRDTERVRSALQAFEERRKKHTSQVSQMAWINGIMFHRLPAWLAPARDLVFDHTPLLQKVIGEATPGQILSQLSEIDEVEAGRRRLGAATSTVAEQPA